MPIRINATLHLSMLHHVGTTELHKNVLKRKFLQRTFQPDHPHSQMLIVRSVVANPELSVLLLDVFTPNYPKKTCTQQRCSKKYCRKSLFSQRLTQLPLLK